MAMMRSQSSSRSPKYKILSMDGGGIYGLVTATWLRQLAEQQPRFLAEPTRDPRLEWPSPEAELTVFSGASSGAVNALLLAKYERPREALLSGVLEGFWKNAGVFSNTDPVTSWTSYWGIGAWFGTEDFKRVLDEYFGSLTLKELRHNVLITCFDWYGHAPDEFIQFDAPPGAPSAPGASKVHSWRPRTFTNFLPRGNPKDWDYRVADIAYAACAAPGFREVRGGLADAASFTVNPTVDAIAGITQLVRWHQEHSTSTPSPGEARHDLGLLDEMGILSLGDGTIEPRFWLENFNLGTAQLQMSPTNPLARNFHAPQTWLALDAATKNVDDCARALIGSNRYMRLNPQLLPLPPLVASGMARFPEYRSWLTDQLIPNAVSSPLSRRAVGWAARFLEQQWWLDNEQAQAAG